MPLKLILGLVAGVFVGTLAEAAPADAGDARLRDTLRSTLQALNAAETDRAALQSAAADNDKRLQELNAQVQVLIKRSVADKAAADQASAALAARLVEQEKTLAQLRQALEKAQASAQSQAEALRAADKQRAHLVAANQALERHLAECQAKNAALFKTGNEILTRYERYGLGQALAAKEPFVGLTRVKLENQVQDYQDKLLDERISP